MKTLEKNLDIAQTKIGKVKGLLKISQKVDKYDPQPVIETNINSTQQEIELLESTTLMKREEFNKRVINVEQLVS